MTDKTLAELGEELANATVGYKEAARQAREASTRETTMRNRLNDAQKAFDKHVDALRKEAPAGDWADRGRRMTEVSE